jgi:hypothetical protein
LSVGDHLTHDEAVSFWCRNFNQGSQVGVEYFCEAVNADFSEVVFQAELAELKEGTVSMEEVMQDFFSDLINKVSIDQTTVSLNAFELFTRQKGLHRPLSNLFSEVLMRHKAARSMRLNDTIV